MATLAEIRSSIIGQALGQVPSDDRRLRKRFVDHVIRSVRSELIKEISRKSAGLSQDFYQRICCLDVLCDEIVCGQYKIPLKTRYLQIPQLESIPFNPQYLGPADGRTPFTRIPFGQFPFYTGGSFRNRAGAFSIVDDKAFLHFPVGLNAASMCIYGILEDPMENSCVTLKEDDPYPLPQNMVHKLEIIALRQLLSTLPIQADAVNDSKDSQLDQPQQRIQPPQ
jgi:hypothetical protein